MDLLSTALEITAYKRGTQLHVIKITSIALQTDIAIIWKTLAGAALRPASEGYYQPTMKVSHFLLTITTTMHKRNEIRGKV